MLEGHNDTEKYKPGKGIRRVTVVERFAFLNRESRVDLIEKMTFEGKKWRGGN